MRFHCYIYSKRCQVLLIWLISWPDLAFNRIKMGIGLLKVPKHCISGTFFVSENVTLSLTIMETIVEITNSEI